jgi:hypothetical protein
VETQIMMVVALVASLRSYIPSIDGWKVPLCVLLASAAVVVAGGALPLWPELAQRIVMLALGAFGGMKVADRLVDRHAEASQQ